MRGTSTLKRTRLKKVSKTGTIKDRIQALLRKIGLALWGEKCAFALFQAETKRKCQPPLQYDHLEPRSINELFADFLNGQILCKIHNQWKHYHPREALRIERKLYGDERMDELARRSKLSKPMSKKDWLQVEAELELKVAELER